MEQSLQEFQEYLGRHAPAGLIPHCLDSMAVYFNIARTGKYVLCPADDLPAADISKAIATMTGKDVRTISFVSAASFPEGPDAAIGIWRGTSNSFWEALYSSHHHTLWHGPSREIISPRQMQARRDTLNSLWEEIKSRVGDAVTEAVSGVLPNDLGWNLRNSLLKGVWYALFYFNGFVATGNEERMIRLTPILRWLASCLPIGQKTDRPEIWIVLSA